MGALQAGQVLLRGELFLLIMFLVVLLLVFLRMDQRLVDSTRARLPVDFSLDRLAISIPVSVPFSLYLCPSLPDSLSLLSLSLSIPPSSSLCLLASPIRSLHSAAPDLHPVPSRPPLIPADPSSWPPSSSPPPCCPTPAHPAPSDTTKVVECFRRIALTGLAVFIYPDSSAQIAVVLLLSVVFMVVSEILAPFARPVEMWLYRVGHYVVFASMYLALLLRVDVSDERDQSQEVR